MNQVLDKFPPLLEVSLTSQGFQLTHWRHNTLVNEDMRDFHRGTVQGLLGFKAPALILNAIVNNEAHNGQFAETMTKLEELARAYELELHIPELWNKSLMAHLISKRGYTKTGIDQVMLKNTR